MARYISDQMIRTQITKFYLVMILWPLYLVFLPYMFKVYGLWALLFVVFPGAYLYVWLAYLMHETWHKYVPWIPNDTLYILLSWMLFTDPQLYRLVHGYHHSQVNSYDDHEFHPAGRINNRLLRIIYNSAEIIFGTAFLVLFSSFSIRSDERFKDKFSIASQIYTVVAVTFFIAALTWISHLLFSIPVTQILLIYLLNLWVCSFILHQGQLIEHGNLIVEGDFENRNMATGNLSVHNYFYKALCLYFHSDVREHVLHHTNVHLYSRPFPGAVPMPEHARYITISSHLKTLLQMFCGVEKIEK